MKGLLSASFTFLSLLTAFSCFRASGRPSILLIIIDTLRADALGCYGSPVRGVSPCMDSLAASGTLWEQCQAQSPWTRPSVASILTGLTEREHRAGITEYGIHTGLAPEVVCIQELLAAEGYGTFAVMNNIHITSEFGFARGFDRFVYITARDSGNAAECVDSLMCWLASNGSHRFFAVLHIMDPHAPYMPPEPYCTFYLPPGDTVTAVSWESAGNTTTRPDQLEHYRALYNGEITWVDSQLFRLFSEMRARGIADSTVIILTSDHGEEFLEHGYVGHGHSLHDQLLHVPLIISGPGFRGGGRERFRAAHIDLFPTIAAVAGVKAPEGLIGVDLGGGSNLDRYVASSGVIFPGLMNGLEPLACVCRNG
ncbi:sulfatase, partial [Candidatus Fermentibacteria bacterium]|nr:sulfatase [Candidatus Fermentibacteria bacterium]